MSHSPLLSLPGPSADLLDEIETALAPARGFVVGSGGLSHDPPVPTLATAPPAALERIVHGAPMSTEARQARQVAVMEAARAFAHGQSPLQPLNPDWDRAFLEVLDSNRLTEVD